MRKCAALSVAIAAFVLGSAMAGKLLVINQPRTSDVILVLAGEWNNARLGKAIDLLQAGSAKSIVVDASSDLTIYGITPAKLAQEFISNNYGNVAQAIHVCPISGDSTVQESVYAAQCLSLLHPATVLIVTSDYHTRRALSIFGKRCPQYRWSAAAADDPYFFGVRWWNSREWAKTTWSEWVRLVWWECIERWTIRTTTSPAASCNDCRSRSLRGTVG
jgi:uncharacterized SAM-binding protein YcdF (DUF218 family)